MPSSVIARFAYHPDDHRLEVWFRTGRCYAYHNVPAAVAAALERAPSKGSYFNAHIRDAFESTRIDRPPVG